MNKFNEDELKTQKLKVILGQISDCLTEEETAKLKTLTKEDERRSFIIDLYNKYIDAEIAKTDQNAADEAAKKAAEEAKKAEEEKKAAEAAEKARQRAAANTTTAQKDVNINISFTVDIRGVYGYNGTFTITCEKLLVLIFRNKSTKVTFRSPERAKQFINIVKNVKVIKGVNFTETDRTRVIKQICDVNGVKA